MFCGGWIIILGAIVAATANHMAQLVVGRFILGAGIQMMTVAAPAYAIEIAPPHWRGRCAGKMSPFLSSYEEATDTPQVSTTTAGSAAVSPLL